MANHEMRFRLRGVDIIRWKICMMTQWRDLRGALLYAG